MGSGGAVGVGHAPTVGVTDGLQVRSHRLVLVDCFLSHEDSIAGGLGACYIPVDIGTAVRLGNPFRLPVKAPLNMAQDVPGGVCFIQVTVTPVRRRLLYSAV